jgi:hypothetical protein
MSSGTLPKGSTAQPEAVRDQWVADVKKLVAEAEGWSREQGWLTHQDSRTLTEEFLGTYDVPTLTIRHPSAALLLEPVARYVVGAEGRIDLAVFPSYDKLLVVLGEDGAWRIASPARPEWEEPWARENFIRLAEQLARG